MASVEGEAAAAAPFLEKNPQLFFDGCPGCAMDRRKAENPGIPYRLFFHIWIIILVSSSMGLICYELNIERVGKESKMGASYNETLHKHKLDKKEDQTTRYSFARLADFEESTEEHTSSTKYMDLLKNWPLISSIILFCIISFDDSAYTEIFSLWAESDKMFGGLSFSSKDVGQVLVVGGASILLYQTFIYPHIVKVHGPINTSRVAAISSMTLLFTYPYMTHLPRLWLSIIINIAAALKSIFVVTVVTCCFILQNNSVPQDQRATANGLATTFMSFFKTISPAGAGIVFSWAQKRQDAFFFPGDQMVFFLLGVVVLVEFIWTFRPFLAVSEQFSPH
ncbi:hypothetical protein C2845_PM05G06320 [Panicum miliaceum]|uniref:Peptide/nitrate transporter n=1 Tax=Panicum miliaceum TaxID=4540 RepID=A0A3L6SZ09_PANMI|nr:hypothetical protein C2845_PM05G06320 [Panicum miliaceum]